MIFILTDDDDVTTNDVLDWLSYYNMKFIRLNGNNLVEILNVRLSNSVIEFEIKMGNLIIKNSEISAYWYRRGALINNIKFINHKNEGGVTPPAPARLHRVVNSKIQKTYQHLIYPPW